ncbi:hypothetical protein TKK_0006527 [Trichogramma kaykai]
MGFQEPLDYNVTHRWLQYTRTEDPNLVLYFDVLASLSPDRIQQAGALFIANNTFMITTALHTVQFTGTQIQQIAARDVDLSPRAWKMAVLEGLTKNVQASHNSKCLLYLFSHRHCVHMIGASAPANFAAARDWNIPRLPYLLPGPMALQSPHHPPQAGNPMCLLSLLDVVPAEWGIVDSEATCSFSRELLLQDERVWLAHRGTDKYRVRKMSKEECFTYIDYGSLASNCIAQIVTDAVPGEPQMTWLAIQPDGQWEMVMQAGVNPHLPVWLPGQRCWEPCTFMNWDWDQELIYSPRLTADALGPGFNLLRAVGYLMEERVEEENRPDPPVRPAFMVRGPILAPAPPLVSNPAPVQPANIANDNLVVLPGMGELGQVPALDNASTQGNP